LFFFFGLGGGGRRKSGLVNLVKCSFFRFSLIYVATGPRVIQISQWAHLSLEIEILFLISHKVLLI